MSANLKGKIIKEIESFYWGKYVIKDINTSKMNIFLKSILIGKDRIPLWVKMEDLNYKEMLELLETEEQAELIHSCMEYEYSKGFVEKNKKKLNDNIRDYNYEIDWEIEKIKSEIEKIEKKHSSWIKWFFDNDKLMFGGIGLFVLAVVFVIIGWSTESKIWIWGIVIIVILVVVVVIDQSIVKNKAVSKMKDIHKEDYVEYKKLKEKIKELQKKKKKEYE